MRDAMNEGSMAQVADESVCINNDNTHNKLMTDCFSFGSNTVAGFCMQIALISSLSCVFQEDGGK
jgi:hypothetical protein